MAKGISLHVGVNYFDSNHYGSDGVLKGCENDARCLSELAQSQGFLSTKLLSPEASREAVIRAISMAASELLEGDIYFISYSGHGGRIPDRSGDEADLLDETWCLFNAQLIDDELNVLFSRFKSGVRILVVSDSCHSGTVTKLAKPEKIIHYSEYTPRYLPPRESENVWKRNQAFYQNLETPRSFPIVKASVSLISGCQDNQYSYDGEKNGAFTSQLLNIWDGGRFTGNYEQFYRRILVGMPAYQSPNYFKTGANNPAFDKEKPFQI